jgi:hypothetical protein
MHAVYDIDGCLNRWIAPSKLLKDYCDHFVAKTEELSMMASEGKLVLTAFTEGLTFSSEVIKQAVHTVVTLDPGEFQSYVVELVDEEVTFSLKDFKVECSTLLFKLK